MGFRAFGPAWTVGSVLSTVMVAVAPVHASELSAWSYSEATQQLEFSLPQSVLPRFFLLAEPTRIVLDIPEIRFCCGWSISVGIYWGSCSKAQ
ncbi:MAG: hypothetical protein AAFU71_05570, partial [Cyanobacteria bacterium J06632_22]